MLVRCFLDEVHGSPWLSKSLDDNVHHSEISKINQAYTHIQMRTVVYDVYLYTSMQRCVYDVYLCMCVQHSWLKHPAGLCGSRTCAEMITQRERLLSIFQIFSDLCLVILGHWWLMIPLSPELFRPPCLLCSGAPAFWPW